MYLNINRGWRLLSMFFIAGPLFKVLDWLYLQFFYLTQSFTGLLGLINVFNCLIILLAFMLWPKSPKLRDAKFEEASNEDFYVY